MKHRPVPRQEGYDRVQWTLCRLSIAVELALALSPAVRSITAGLTTTVGTRWPFAMEHCRSADTPGCQAGEANIWRRQVATR